MGGRVECVFFASVSSFVVVLCLLNAGEVGRSGFRLLLFASAVFVSSVTVVCEVWSVRRAAGGGSGAPVGEATCLRRGFSSLKDLTAGMLETRSRSLGWRSSGCCLMGDRSRGCGERLQGLVVSAGFGVRLFSMLLLIKSCMVTN